MASEAVGPDRSDVEYLPGFVADAFVHAVAVGGEDATVDELLHVWIAGRQCIELAADAVDRAGAPGTTLDANLTVACGKGGLRLARLQRGGRKPMAAAEFLRGHPVPAETELH